MPDENRPRGNSLLNKGPTKPPEPKKIITGKVQLHKKSIGQRLVDLIFAEELNQAARHVLYDVLIPKARDIIADSVTTMLYGGSRRSGSERPGSSSTKYVPYSTSTLPRRETVMPTPKSLTENLIFDTPEDAHSVLGNLLDYLNTYPEVTVGYLYGLLGYQSDQTKENYGWYTLDGASVIAVRDGYLLQLPRPVLLSR